MKNEKLTIDDCGDLLEFIRSYIETNGFPPTTREMAEGCGFLGTAMVQRRLNLLRDEGLVDWLPGSSRTLRVLRMGGT